MAQLNCHFVAMAGLHGCLPATCNAYEHYRDAVDAMVALHELDTARAATLRERGYIELNRCDGNEYIEIQECDCSNMSVHNDY